MGYLDSVSLGIKNGCTIKICIWSIEYNDCYSTDFRHASLTKTSIEHTIIKDDLSIYSVYCYSLFKFDTFRYNSKRRVSWTTTTMIISPTNVKINGTSNDGEYSYRKYQKNKKTKQINCKPHGRQITFWILCGFFTIPK